jgi:hypothetical protein
MDQAIARALTLARAALRHETRAATFAWGGTDASGTASPE